MSNKIKEERILVIPKLSKYELDLRNFKLTHEELIEKYKNEGVNFERIIESYKIQLNARERLRKVLPKARFIQRDELTREIVKDFDVLISLGGDNHLMYISHFVDSKFLIGINSDPGRSEGALTNFNIVSFEKFIPDFLSGNYRIEQWSRLKIELNGKVIWPLVTGDVFLGETERWNMSRHIIRFNGKEEEQKGSGFLISTAAGSTGWHSSAVRYLKPEGEILKHIEKEAVFLLTEPYHGKLSGTELIHGYLNPNEEIEIDSLNDSSGVVSIDSLWNFKFNRGDKVIVSVSEKPLKVINLNGD